MSVKHNLEGFKMDLQKFGKKLVPKKIIDIQRWAVIELYRRVLMRTPVDKGFLRGNWGLAIGSPESRANGKSGAVKKGGLTAEEAKYVRSVTNFLSTMPLGQIVWLCNTMPYCEVVEFGMYPNPPKKGSFVKLTKRSKHGTWVMKSSGGFSKQAPAGMVQVSINELKTWFDNLNQSQQWPAPDAGG